MSMIGRAFKPFGYTLVPSKSLAKLPQVTFLQRLFALLEIDCVFDVGANRGQFGSSLRKDVGFQGTIISFEPVPASLEKLRDSAKGDSRWIVQPYALGSAAGKIKMNVMANNVFSSFLSPDHQHIERFRSMNRVVEQIDVEVKTLSTVVPELVAATKSSSLYLKLDTQGFDLDVAVGGGQAMSAFRALQTEASVVPIYAGMPDFSKSIAAFREMGFEVSAFFQVNPKSHFPRMIEFDCHMINRAFLPSSVSAAPAPDGIGPRQ